MCLIDYKKIDTSKRKRGIKCYKVLETTYGTFDSPLFGDHDGGHAWTIGEIREIEAETPWLTDTYRSNPTTDFYAPCITGDGYHTCKTLKSVKEYLKWLNGHGSIRKFVIAECMIPKDTKYVYEGTAVVSSDDEGYPGYVSQSLKIVKLLKKA